MISANTTMGHLLLGYSCETLGVYPFTPVNIGTIRKPFAEVFDCNLLDAQVILIPGISTYVGADISSGLLSCGFEVIEKSNMNLLYVPKDSELVTKLMKVYKEETGRDDQPMAIGGGTYAKHFPNMVAFGPMFPEDEQTIHQPNERVEIDKATLEA